MDRLIKRVKKPTTPTTFLKKVLKELNKFFISL